MAMATRQNEAVKIVVPAFLVTLVQYVEGGFYNICSNQYISNYIKFLVKRIKISRCTVLDIRKKQCHSMSKKKASPEANRLTASLPLNHWEAGRLVTHLVSCSQADLNKCWEST